MCKTGTENYTCDLTDMEVIEDLKKIIFRVIRGEIWLEQTTLNMIKRSESRCYFDGNVGKYKIGCVCFKMTLTVEYLYVVRMMFLERDADDSEGRIL